MLTVSKSEQLTFESDLDDCIYFQLTEILSNWEEKKKASNMVEEVFFTDKPNIQQSLIFLFFMFELCKKEITYFSFGRSFMVKKKNLSIKGIAPWIQMAPCRIHTVMQFFRMLKHGCLAMSVA